jgi:hypothetical protein
VIPTSEGAPCPAVSAAFEGEDRAGSGHLYPIRTEVARLSELSVAPPQARAYGSLRSCVLLKGSQYGFESRRGHHRSPHRTEALTRQYPVK